MCVRSVYAEFDDDVSNTFITLSTNIVDGGTWNPDHDILAFNNNSFFANKIDYKPTNLTWYRVRTTHMDDRSIDFTIPIPKIKIMKKLYLQIEFRQIE